MNKEALGPPFLCYAYVKDFKPLINALLIFD